MGKIVGRFQKARLDYQSRLGRPVTVEEVARAIGISRQSLSGIENGNALPRYGTLAKLCMLYGVQPGELLALEERLARLLAVTRHNTNSRAETEHAGVVPATSAAHC
jgi:transcriptional regulator with XRE-family HTH domain